VNRDQLDVLCHSLPGTEPDVKWDCDLCYCVAGKMYVVTSTDKAGKSLSLKSTPEGFTQLTSREGFKPAPYLARYSWVLVDNIDAVADEELEMLVRASYELVVAKLPKRVQRSLRRGRSEGPV